MTRFRRNPIPRFIPIQNPSVCRLNLNGRKIPWSWVVAPMSFEDWSPWNGASWVRAGSVRLGAACPGQGWAQGCPWSPRKAGFFTRGGWAVGNWSPWTTFLRDWPISPRLSHQPADDRWALPFSKDGNTLLQVYYQFLRNQISHFLKGNLSKEHCLVLKWIILPGWGWESPCYPPGPVSQ